MKNLLCTDRIFSILILISCGILIFCWIFLSRKKTTKPYTFETVKLIENPHLPNFLYLPVTIDDSVYHFLFDTGMGYSVIDSGLAERIGLCVDETHFDILREPNGHERCDSFGFSNKIYSIGNFKIKGFFLLNGVKGQWVKTELMQKVGAILGMEIIQHLNLLFDFENNTVTISKDQIQIPALADDQILNLDFFCEIGSGTSVDIEIDGEKIENVLFDTGYEHTFRSFEKNKSMDIIFSKSDYEVYSRVPHVSFILTKNDESAYIFDTIKINNFTMQGLFALEHNDYVQTIITANFVRRFRMMYYDSMNKKIQLYVSPSDSVRHHKKDMQNIYRSLLQLLYQDTVGGTLDVPITLIDSVFRANE